MTPVLSVDDYGLNDPFIMLADDHLDLGERPIGGAHPHAGFETVTLLVEGEIVDRDEGGTIRTTCSSAACLAVFFFVAS